jgi:hypothetical protein
MDIIMNTLPIELQRKIHSYIVTLRSPKRVLSSKLTYDIQSYVYLKDLTHIYQDCYTDDSNDINFYQNWLENDILIELNDNIAIIDEIRPGLQVLFPNATHMEIFDEVSKHIDNMHDQYILIKRYWKHLSPMKRLNLYHINMKYYKAYVI